MQVSSSGQKMKCYEIWTQTLYNVCAPGVNVLIRRTQEVGNVDHIYIYNFLAVYCLVSNTVVSNN